MTAMTRCPTCAAEIGDKAVCYRCGTLPAIEARLQRTRRGLGDLIQQKVASLPRQLEARHFLWACAVVPFFIIPPLVSLVYAVRAMRQGTTQQIGTNFEWIAIVSAVNLVVSTLVLYKYYFSINDFLLQAPDAIRTFLRRWPFYFPQPNPMPKVTPV